MFALGVSHRSPLRVTMILATSVPLPRLFYAKAIWKTSRCYHVSDSSHMPHAFCLVNCFALHLVKAFLLFLVPSPAKMQSLRKRIFSPLKICLMVTNFCIFLLHYYIHSIRFHNKSCAILLRVTCMGIHMVLRLHCVHKLLL